MSGRLAEIEANPLDWLETAPVDDVLALVNVAKAAWAVVETAMRYETEARINDLADALYALDGGS